MDDIDLRELIHMWCDYKEEDDVNRPEWIETAMKNYKQGKWRIGE